MPSQLLNANIGNIMKIEQCVFIKKSFKLFMFELKEEELKTILLHIKPVCKLNHKDIIGFEQHHT